MNNLSMDYHVKIKRRKNVQVTTETLPVLYLGKGCAPVVHHRAGIILGAQVIYLVEVVLEEVELHPRLDVVEVDGDVAVPVRSALLVPEARGVHQLVYDDPSVDTAGAEAHLENGNYHHLF